MSRARGLAALAALSLVLTACGDIGSGSGDPVGSWSSQRLAAEIGADHSPMLVTSGNDALVVTLSEEATIRSYLSTDGAPFEAGTPLRTDAGFVSSGDVVALPGGGWLLLVSGGMVEDRGDRDPAFDALAFRSADGLTWTPVEETGFTRPVDINDVEIVGGTVVVAGAYRVGASPSMEGFEAHLWTSTDGSSFTEIDLPGVRPPKDYKDDSYAASLTLVGDRVLATGQASRAGAVWTSDDGARTWHTASDSTLEKTHTISGLARVGDVVLAGTGESRAPLRSTDGGDSWDRVDTLPTSSEEAGWAPLWADGDRFWTLTGIDDTSWSTPEVCYADLSQCDRRPAPRVVVSPDGSDWTAVALPAEPEEITGTADGRTLVLEVDAGAIVVHTLPAGTSPPRASEPAKARTVELVTVAKGEAPQAGVRYHAPMYVHCGMDWLWFADTTWRRTDDGPGVETGGGEQAPPDWPLAGQTLYGFATLTDPDHLEYSLDTGEVIATYERDDRAPGCD